jgi:hypothetical protein
MNSIRCLNEQPLHAALKKWCAVAEEGRVAVLINGFLLISIQITLSLKYRWVISHR